MAHEITSTDGLVLVGKRAWHGLGTIIPDHVRPTESLPLFGAEWGVRQIQLQGIDPETGLIVPVEGQRLNIREDNNEPLGIVSDHYQVFSNRQVAEFCEALVEVGGDVSSPVKVETAGTIRGGKKVWFLLRGEEFQVANADSVFPYVLVSNGYDGKTSLSVTPTTIRVVCSNTLHMVIPREAGMPSSAAINIEHMGDLSAKVASARVALQQYDYAMKCTRDSMEVLAAKEVSRKDLIAFFTECYERDILSILKDNDRDVVNENRRRRAKEGFRMFCDRFEQEEELAGSSWWNAMNAYTGYIQHDMKARGKAVDRIEQRQHMNLLGVNADRSIATFNLALAMATAV